MSRRERRPDSRSTTGEPLRSVVGNSFWLSTAEVASRALSFLTIVYLSRTLNLEGMGIVEFGLAVFTAIRMISTNSVGVLAIRWAARSPRAIPRLAGTSLLLSWTYSAVAFVAVVAGVLFLPGSAAMRRAVVLFALAAAVVVPGLQFVFVGRERARVLGIAAPLGQAAFLGLCVAGVRGPGDFLRVPVFLMIGTAVRSGVMLVAFIAEYGRVQFAIGAAWFARWLRSTLRVSPGSVARGLMATVDLLVLALVVGPEQVAAYGIASKIPLFLCTLASLVHVALFPTVARARAAGHGSALAARMDVLRALLGAALPGALCLALVSGPLILLLFTEKFRAAVPLFALLVWRVPLVAASGLLRTAVWARRPFLDARISVEGLVVTVAAVATLCLLAGPVGAAWGILLGEATVLRLYAREALPPIGDLIRGDPGWPARVGLALALAAGVGALASRCGGAPAVLAALAGSVAAGLVADLPYARRLWRS